MFVSLFIFQSAKFFQALKLSTYTVFSIQKLNIVNNYSAMLQYRSAHVLRGVPCLPKGLQSHMNNNNNATNNNNKKGGLPWCQEKKYKYIYFLSFQYFPLHTSLTPKGKVKIFVTQGVKFESFLLILFLHFWQCKAL